MTRFMVWSFLTIFLYGSLLTLYMLIAGVYFYKGKQKEDVNEKVMVYGFAFWFLFSSGLTHIFTALAIMQVPGTYENYTFYATEYDLTHPQSMRVFFVILAALSHGTGRTIFIYAFERVVKRTRYLLTITCIALIIFNLIFAIFISFELSAFIYFNFMVPFFGVTLLIILVIYTRRSRLEGKAVASFFYLWVSISNLAGIYNRLGYLYFSAMCIAPVLFIFGILMVLVPLVINPKYLSRALRYWRISGLSIAILYLVSWILVFFIYGNPNDPLTNTNLSLDIVIGGILFMVMYFFIARSIKHEKPLEEKEEASSGFGVLVKPQRITEEEVSISKEKKICLVCKGKVLGITFICRECESFYCGKCYSALVNLENACWACDNALDESKPSKPFKKEEEKVEVEISEKPEKTPKKPG